VLTGLGVMAARGQLKIVQRAAVDGSIHLWQLLWRSTKLGSVSLKSKC
jgi:hypothetical protein